MKLFILDAKQLSFDSVEINGLTSDFKKIIIIVTNIQHHSYIFLKKEDTDQNAISTFLSLRHNLHGRAVSLKKTTRRFFHNSTISNEPTTCYRIRYPSNQFIPSIFLEKSSSCISQIFSCHTDLIEELFIRRNLFGWVDIDCSSKNIAKSDKTLSTKDYEEMDYPSAKDIVACSLFITEDQDLVFNDPSVSLSQVSVVYTYKSSPNLKQVCVIDIYPYMLEFYTKQLNYDINFLAGSDTTDLQKAQWIYDQANRMDLLNILLSLSEQTLLPISRLTVRTNRVEWLIMRRLKYIRCVYPENDKKRAEVTHTYQGGLVLEARQGIYTTPVSLLDFTSMYPSVCVELNICWTKEGLVIAHLMKSLIQRRQEILANKHMHVAPAAASLATKLLANTIYGMLAYSFSKFYTPELASKIATRGRELLLSTVGYITKHHPNVPIIYGDTDSVMISCDKDVSIQIATEINERNHTAIQLKHEDTFRKVVIFAKKKYIAESQSGSISLKGVDSKKKGICRLGGLMCAEMLSHLLERDVLRVEDFKQILARYVKIIESASHPTEDFIITKQLSRDPEKYYLVQGQAHVQAALLASKVSSVKYKKFDFVRYFVGQNEEMFPDLPTFHTKSIDRQWYVAHINSIADRVMNILPDYSITDLILVKKPPNPPASSISDFSIEIECVCSNIIQHSGFSVVLERSELPHPSEAHISIFDITPLPLITCPGCGLDIKKINTASIDCKSIPKQICKILFFDLRYALSQFKCRACQQIAASAFLPNIKGYYNLRNLF